MRRSRNNGNRKIEKAVVDILQSRSRSRIYLYLLRRNGAKTEQIIKGTKLHPSTVRETLSDMFNDKQIIRKKIKNDCIGKNPYMYYAMPPIKLLKRHTDEIEDRLNKFASLAFDDKNYRYVRIKIQENVVKTWM